MISQLLHQLREVPEYFMALKGALAVLAMGLPVYAGLWYFLHRRRLKISVWVTLNFIGAFILFAGLAFLLASPLASYVRGSILTIYLFVTCIWAALGAVSLIDVFLIRHYLIQVKHVYVSPPLQAVIKLVVFCLAVLPIFRYVLHFNPLTLVAIPTIATAGVALAMQDTLKAFIASLGLGKIVRLGEWISFQNKEGQVVAINWARTVLETADGQRLFIPNALLLNGVFSRLAAGSSARQVSLKVTVPYDVAPERVKETLLQSLDSVAGVTLQQKPLACLQEFGDSGMIYSLFYAIDDFTQRPQIQDAVASRVWQAFQKKKIAIAYPTRTVHLQKDL